MEKLDEITFSNDKEKESFRLLKHGLDTFGAGIVFASSFGAEDMVLLDMIDRLPTPITTVSLDTGRMFQEVYELIEEARLRYNVPIQLLFPESYAVEKMHERFGPNLMYASKDSRLLCCRIRKDDPLSKELKKRQAWITGMRRNQSKLRQSIVPIEEDSLHGGITKINPLYQWDKQDIWDYIKKKNVPYNKLHDQGFPSIGCLPCTRAVKLGEDERSGRWSWEKGSTRECGIHTKEEPKNE